MIDKYKTFVYRHNKQCNQEQPVSSINILITPQDKLGRLLQLRHPDYKLVVFC